MGKGSPLPHYVILYMRMKELAKALIKEGKEPDRTSIDPGTIQMQWLKKEVMIAETALGKERSILTEWSPFLEGLVAGYYLGGGKGDPSFANCLFPSSPKGSRHAPDGNPNLGYETPEEAAAAGIPYETIAEVRAQYAAVGIR